MTSNLDHNISKLDLRMFNTEQFNNLNYDSDDATTIFTNNL